MAQFHMPDLHKALKKHFGYDAFRPGQEAVVRDTLAGRDGLAIMPTGGGKSLCFQLPALLREGLTVVVSPLIALMQDQVRLLADNGIRATFLNSSLTAAESASRRKDLLHGEYQLLYVAPERLLLPEFLDGLLPRLKVCAFVIDEAHCVSEWGHDFRPDYRQLKTLRSRFAQTPMWGFTATATQRVRQDIVTQLALHEPAIHIASFNRPNLFYAVRPKNPRSYDELFKECKSGDSGIVYCLSRRRVDELAARLSADGVRALPYHAGLDADTRRDNQNAFIRDDAQVMVATVAFGMGINKPDVRWVVHFDLPKTLEGYYQEAGRAGRDGDPARCLLYFGLGDIRTAEFLIQQKVDPLTGDALEQEQRLARQQLRQVLDYAESAECRRVVQLRYFGEVYEPPCGACDNCLDPMPIQDWTLEARQFLSCIARLAQRREHFGAAHIIEVLRGADTEKVRSRGHDSLSVYGIGKQRTLEEWRLLTRALLNQGVLDETQDGFPVLRLNDRSWEVLRGQRELKFATPPARVKTNKRRRGTAAEMQTPGEATLFEALRGLRKQLADTHKLPPYVIFHDASLRRMAELQPKDLTQFAQIPGVGQAKLARYGAAFTGEIRKFLERSA